MKKSSKKYAFIDRDGTLIYEPQDTFYVDSVERLQVNPGMVEYLKKLQDEGFVLAMVTNQDYLGQASNPLDVFEEVQAELARRLSENGVEFEQVLVCPHGADEGCSCRKPKTGLADGLKDIDRANSLMIGDRETDMEFARNLGIKGVKLKVNQGIRRAAL